MSRKRRKRRHRPAQGAPPGTLVASADAAESAYDVIRYDEHHYSEESVNSLDECLKTYDSHRGFWLNVEGLADVEGLKNIGRHFNIHPLAQEEILYPQRPKFEQHENGILMTVAMPFHRDEKLEFEKLTLFLGKGFVLTFQEGAPGDCLEPVRLRLREKKGRIRTLECDYLAYAIIDTVIDSYFPLLERAEDELNDIEDALLERPSKFHREAVRSVRGEVQALSRQLRLLRDALSGMTRSGNQFINDQTKPYFEDCYDHVLHLLEDASRHRDTAHDLLELHSANLSQRMNEATQTLTIIATLFIPLSFIVGLYGMNFDPDASPWNMPELRMRYGYPGILVFMTIVALFLVRYFHRKGWLNPD
jgi:magnesium transporter